MADAPDPSQRSLPAAPPPDDLRRHAGRTFGPPKTDADAVGPAPPSSPPYRLSGPAEAARGAVDEAIEARIPESALNTSTVSAPQESLRARCLARGSVRDSVTVQPDDLIEVEFDQGERLWMRGDDFRINFGQTVVGRDATGAEEVQVPLRCRWRRADWKRGGRSPGSSKASMSSV